METTRLTVVSNRLAIVVDRDESGQYTIKPGSGGLVTALGPVLRDRGGQWIGWLGSSTAPSPPSRNSGLSGPKNRLSSKPRNCPRSADGR